ncbi:EAL domain-containing protein [Rhodoferax sp. AJA081-3]|uniref:EAL domain-containing protein n=1 Tax=Rhodoferax sp. AJA081-3 TaxID=2752316 RepID=UPI001AE070D3|nr:EAL domain-containing protein [Rhodoferax sp. AJA081-3]QTN29996.1 EAL domain-containing protein [Rhodoferax sp. AJA081-3]
MTDAFDREVFEGQELVFQWGDPGDSAYVIEEGCVEVLTGVGTEQRRIAILTEGAMFGEVALLDRQPRTASVRALVPTRLIRIDRSHVEELLLRSDSVIQYLLHLLLARFRSTHDAAGLQQRLGNPDANPADAATAALDLHKAAVRTLSLAQDLSDAIDRQQLELFYQPLIAFDGLAVVGFEALIRWHHPSLGLVSPAEFIPLAEKTGLIHRIGQWVLQRAVADWSELRPFCVDSARHQPFMSINLSAPELGGGDIVAAVQTCLSEHGMAPHELRIELTETIIIQNMDDVARSLHRLRALGIGIALDDFGTGYAGLDYLQSLPFTCLKIDKTFVQQVNQSERSLHIIKAALELARSIGMSTIAEGIEDAEIADQLRALGCSHAQGYHYGKPMPKDQMAAWTLKHRAAQMAHTAALKP